MGASEIYLEVYWVFNQQYIANFLLWIFLHLFCAQVLSNL